MQLESLSARETTTLRQCEAVIRRGKKAFLETGEALATINDQRLYRASHATFAEYCKDRWAFTAKHAYGFINSFKVVCEIFGATDKSQVHPSKMSQLLALKGLSPDRVKEVMKMALNQAKATGHLMTAKDLRQARKKLYPPESPTTSGGGDASGASSGLDSANVPIIEPSDILLWVVEVEKLLNEKKIQEALESLSRIHNAIEAWIKSQQLEKAA